MRRRSRSLPDPQTLLADYLSFIICHCGFSSSTHRQYRKALSEFLAYLARQKLSVIKVTVKDLDDFILEVAGWGMSRSHMGIRTIALRGFLRYLQGEGWLERDLARYVESPRIYRESTVPSHFTWEELKELLASIKGDGKEALRDRAMLVILCVYGLRSSEVAKLSLDDIDWSHKALRVPDRKGDSNLLLPLLPVVEAVLGQYIRNGRPSDVTYREILIKNSGRPFRNGLEITKRIHILVKRAGLQSGRGCHAIRRAVGTRLVEQGRGLQEVALILGHRDVKTTRIYLRLSMEFLRDVADNYGEVL